MRKSNPVFDLLLIYKTVYERERKKSYFISGRDFKEAKTFLELNTDLDTDLIETHALEYFKGKNDFWAGKEFPAYGLLMQFTEYAPQVKKRIKRYCNICFTEHYKDEPHAVVKPADPSVVREAKEQISSLLSGMKQ